VSVISRSLEPSSLGLPPKDVDVAVSAWRHSHPRGWLAARTAECAHRLSSIEQGLD